MKRVLSKEQTNPLGGSKTLNCVDPIVPAIVTSELSFVERLVMLSQPGEKVTGFPLHKSEVHDAEPEGVVVTC